MAIVDNPIIDHDKIRADIQISHIDRALRNEFEAKVAKHITETVMPQIEANIKLYAKEAVAAWATKMQMQEKLGAFDRVTEVLVTFTENIINKVEPTHFEVKEKT